MVTSYGEGGGGGQGKFYPYKMGGGVVLAMLKGGRTSFGVVFMGKLEVLAILKGEAGWCVLNMSLSGGRGGDPISYVTKQHVTCPF